MTMRTPQESFDDEDDDSGSSQIDAEVIKSYLSFAARAIRKRVALVMIVFSVVVVLVSAVLAVWPRTYYCETRLTAQSAGAAVSAQERKRLRQPSLLVSRVILFPALCIGAFVAARSEWLHEPERIAPRSRVLDTCRILGRYVA